MSGKWSVTWGWPAGALGQVTGGLLTKGSLSGSWDGGTLPARPLKRRVLK